MSTDDPYGRPVVWPRRYFWVLWLWAALMVTMQWQRALELIAWADARQDTGGAADVDGAAADVSAGSTQGSTGRAAGPGRAGGDGGDDPVCPGSPAGDCCC